MHDVTFSDRPPIPRCDTCGQPADPATGKIRHRMLAPRPDREDIEEWIFDGSAEATDGCFVEPDGICPHGHRSWLLVLGLI